MVTFTYPQIAVSLSGGATEATLQLAVDSLAFLEEVDYATETTSQQLLDELSNKANLADTQPVSLASVPLPTGAATSANQDLQATAAKQDLLLAELALKADLTETQPVSIAGTVAISGALTDAELRATAVPVSGTFYQATQPVSAVSLPLPADAATQTTLAALLAELQLKADLTETQPIQPVRSASATLANVASSATNVTLQASNAARKGLSIFNDSTAVLYVKFGATASTTSYTVQIASLGYYEVPQPCYTGIVDGIWASANGNARMTEW